MNIFHFLGLNFLLGAALFLFVGASELFGFLFIISQIWIVGGCIIQILYKED